MVFDFAAQPPEIISAKIYSGPGAESLEAAASAWDALSAELQSTAADYQSVIAGLVSGDWTGPSSAAAAAAAQPYVTWLTTTAAQAEQTASQARAAASAYQTALAATVSPAEIITNRTELLTQLQTNLLGQNNASIAALEAEYTQFWAQNIAAMTGYAGSSQAATTGLGSFTEAPQTTNSNAAAAQAAAATSAATTAPTSDLDTILGQIETDLNSFSKALTSLNGDYTNFFTNGFGILPGGSTLSPLYQNLFSFANTAGNQATYTNVVNSTTSLGISQFKNFFIYQPWSRGVALGSLNGGLSSPGHLTPHVGGIGGRAAAAAIGGAHTIGTLSVPPSWASATPAVRLAATALPDGAFAATAAPGFDIPQSLINQTTMGSLTGGALGSPASRVVSSTGVRPKVLPAGKRSKAPVKLDQVIAKLQQAPDEVQHWSVDESGLDELVARLSTKPGIHAVHLTDDKAAAAAAKLATETG